MPMELQSVPEGMVEGLTARLVERFGVQVAPSTIATLVQTSCEGFRSAPVQNYVSVLVEHHVADHLRTMLAAERRPLA